jgi:PAS domain S-box-containing protein
MFGYAATELVGGSLQRLMPERMRARHAGGIARYRTTGERHIPWSGLRLPVLTSDGRELPVEIAFGEFVANGRRIFSGILRDVSEQLAAEAARRSLNEVLTSQALELEQQVEEAQALSEELEEANERLIAGNEALRQGEARYRALVEAGAGKVWTVQADAGAVDAAFWTELTGQSLADDPDSWIDAIHPLDRERARASWENALATRTPYDAEYRLRLGSGGYRWFHVRGVPVLDAQGTLREWVGQFSDVDLGPVRARRLLALAAGLSEAATPEAVADAIFREGLAVLGGDAGSLAIVHEDDGHPTGFELVRTAGYDEQVVRHYQRSPLRPGRPLTEAILSRRAVLVDSAVALEARYPDPAAEMIAMGYPAFAVVPVLEGDRVLAALNFSFRSSQAFDDGIRTFLETVGRLCAQALVRARLFESEQTARTRSETIVRAIRDGFIVLDREFRYIYVNPAAEAMLGKSAGALLGRVLWEVFPGAEGGEFARAFRAAFADQEPRRVEAESASLGGWLEANLYPAADTLTVIFQDVTERRMQRRDTEFLAEIGRVLGSSLDYEATLQTLVRAAVPELGDWCAVDIVAEASVGEWPPTIDRVAVHNADPRRTETGLELARRYPPAWSEQEPMTRVLRYGETVFIPRVTDDMIVAGARDESHLDLVRRFGVTSVLLVPLQARGRMLGALTLCMTESHRHYTERDRALAEELGRRAGLAVDNAQLYRTAERARVEAVRANQAKSDLLAKVSHETRQPVHATIGWSDTLKLGIYGTLTAEQHEALQRITQNQDRLLSVLNDLLDMSRIEAGKLDLRPADVRLDELLESVEGTILPQMRAKEIEYASSVIEPDLAVHADRDQLAGILTNLLSNAVKFTRQNGHVTVTCSAAGSQVAVRVADDGIGIPHDALERIFEPFFQVDSGLTRTTTGTGLGLSISRETARAMGGEITVESVEGHGSVFTLVLPTRRLT